MYISDELIDRFIKEDVPYLDLTTLVLGISSQKGTIQFFSREDAVLCGTEEVSKIFNKLNIEVTKTCTSGTLIKSNEIFLEGKGNSEGLHTAWKVSQNILDYSSGIATKTKKLVDKDANVIILAAEGINESNIDEYAKTGINAIVTTSVYYAKAIDIGCNITQL